MLDRHIGQIGSTVPLPAVDKADPEAVGADGPVERVRAGFKVRKQGDVAGEGREQGSGDGAEARVFEGGG